MTSIKIFGNNNFRSVRFFIDMFGVFNNIFNLRLSYYVRDDSYGAPLGLSLP